MVPFPTPQRDGFLSVFLAFAHVLGSSLSTPSKSATLSLPSSLPCFCLYRCPSCLVRSHLTPLLTMFILKVIFLFKLECKLHGHFVRFVH